jgi:hypothetical protein
MILLLPLIAGTREITNKTSGVIINISGHLGESQTKEMKMKFSWGTRKIDQITE